MLLILEQYFKEHPSRLKVVKGLFDHGISVKNGKLFLNSIEISISEAAKAFSVNRRTIYDTIRMVEGKDELRAVMSSIRPGVDRSGALSLMGCEVITLFPMKGCYGSLLETFMSTTSGYLCHLQEVSGINDNRGEDYLRATFDIPLPDKVFQELEKCSCISRIVVESADIDSYAYVCPKCEVKTCPKKLVTKIDGTVH